ncbi:MAG: MerR family transcriptional regulator [Clostridia bacterium]|nr:MerR family transcriptional regulator [Clostridia bacterium]
MSRENGIRHYRIGEYAQKMGVTPDLLKHYEKMDLIHADTTESGYRYYSFTESVALLECLSLRNYGISLQEMSHLLYETDLEGFHTCLNRKAEEMERQVRFSEAVLNQHSKFSAWMDRMKEREAYVLIEEREDMYFLPHSHRHEFLEDTRIQEVLEEWIRWMPMVKSARKICWCAEKGAFTDDYWGLMVPRALLEQYAIPKNGVVEFLPGGRHLVYHYRMESAPGRDGAPWKPLMEAAERMHAEPAGDAVQVVLMNLGMMSQQHRSCGWFSVPLKET